VTEGPAVYLDTSAVVKLVVEEPGSTALLDHLGTRPLRVTSRITEVEVRRAIARVGAVVDAEYDRLARVLATLTMMELDAPLAAAAGRLTPPILGTLDAVHLASALGIASDLEAFVTYDRRLAEAATAAGLPVASPGDSPT
jgi:predicted nucleic acid-binding protein